MLSRDNLSAKLFVLVSAMLCTALPDAVHAACNLIPQTAKTFNSTLGATNRPFASPGEAVELRLRPCDSASPGIAATPAGNVVTVVFTPTSGVPRHAFILTTAADCSALDQSSCTAAQLGAPGNVTCVPGASSGLKVVTRDGVRYLRFKFPDSDAMIGTPTDDVTLAGPVKIAARRETSQGGRG